jgi:oxalate decarboxylase/phosphoglucose isomerase-like protein (cupin superfamily)
MEVVSEARIKRVSQKSDPLPIGQILAPDEFVRNKRKVSDETHRAKPRALCNFAQGFTVFMNLYCIILSMDPLGTRTHEKMKEVLMHPEAPGPNVHYYMIRGGRKKKNITIWEPGTVGGEYIKAYGHYHIIDFKETYYILEGEGILLLQKRAKDASGNSIDDAIEYFEARKVKAGDIIDIPSFMGHLLVNIGNTWLVTSDQSPVELNDNPGAPAHADYEAVKKMRGFAYYVVEENGTPTLVKNTLYKFAPEAKII